MTKEEAWLMWMKESKNYVEYDWDKIQTVDQLKIVVKLICASFGNGSTKATISKSFFERADEETRKRVEAICKEKNT